MRGAIALAVFCLGACAAPVPVAPPAQVEAFRLVTPPRPSAAEGRRLWFLGLAMQSETWSENDVAELYVELQRSVGHYEVLPRPGVFSDRFPPGPGRFPPVIGREIEAEVESVARSAKPDDVVFVYASTHGAPGLLGRELNGREAAPVDVDELKRWLAPLRGHDTVVILSACFSGSFIPALADAHRIIITAARADRSSFGCAAGAEHTVFGDALLQAFAQPGTSLRDAVAATRATVTAQEHALGVTEPSQPQVSVGAAVTRLYNAPVF